MRVLLKISGEALAGGNIGGFDFNILNNIGDIIDELINQKIQVAIVVGAGNFIRGREIQKINIDRCSADNMGMLAININSIAIGDVLLKRGINIKIMNSFNIEGIIEKFNKQKAVKSLNNGKVLILSGGTGNPYFTTDTAGVLRALEIEANLMIKATKVDGVYNKDPKQYSDAEFIEKVSYDEILIKNLKVMDSTAIALAKDNNLKLKVVNLFKPGAILRAINGEKEGTTITYK